jgi:hypothetical protein
MKPSYTLLSHNQCFFVVCKWGAWVSQPMKDRVIYKGGRGSHKDRYILVANMFPN